MKKINIKELNSAMNLIEESKKCILEKFGVTDFENSVYDVAFYTDTISNNVYVIIVDTSRFPNQSSNDINLLFNIETGKLISWSNIKDSETLNNIVNLFSKELSDIHNTVVTDPTIKPIGL